MNREEIIKFKTNTKMRAHQLFVLGIFEILNGLIRVFSFGQLQPNLVLPYIQYVLKKIYKKEKEG